jgi:hypothetical protein
VPESLARSWIRFFQVLVVCGIAMKLYGINDPWKRNDHYNFGGIVTTAYAECLKSTPLEVSKGVPHFCAKGANEKYLHFYRAHPPTVLFAMWGWTNLLGSGEWAYRLFVALFSTLNIAVMYFLARAARPGSLVFAWAAAAFQAVFLGNIYFATHLDFIGEFTVFFVLSAALAALHRRMSLACGLGLCAGFSAWPGYIVFAPLWFYSFLIGKGRKRVMLAALFGFTCALLTMMWLHQTTDIVEFLRAKLLDPGYIQKREKGWSEPLRFAHNFFTSQARLLSPLFAACALFELVWGDGREFLLSIFRPRNWIRLTPFHHAVLLAGGTGLVYALIGHEYMMVHVYLYLLFTPALALLCARFFERSLMANSILGATLGNKKAMAVLCIFLAAVYPYGIFQSNLVHDILNSTAFVLTSLTMIYFLRKPVVGSAPILILIALNSLANASQVANYRNERDTERSFCNKARTEYAHTGKPVVTSEEESNAKTYLYCVGIPVQYQSK